MQSTACQPNHLVVRRPTFDGVRVIFIRRYPYRLFYRVRDDGLEILHIRHTSRQPGDLE